MGDHPGLSRWAAVTQQRSLEGGIRVRVRGGDSRTEAEAGMPLGTAGNILSRSFSQDTTLADTLTPARQTPLWTPDPQRGQRIHFCCFKPPSPRSFAAAAIGNQHTTLLHLLHFSERQRTKYNTGREMRRKRMKRAKNDGRMTEE